MPDKKQDPGWFKNYFESTGDYMGWTPSEGDTSSSRKSAGRAIDRVVGGVQGLTKNERDRLIKVERARASLGGTKPPPSTVKKKKR